MRPAPLPSDQGASWRNGSDLLMGSTKCPDGRTTGGSTAPSAVSNGFRSARRRFLPMNGSCGEAELKRIGHPDRPPRAETHPPSPRQIIHCHLQRRRQGAQRGDRDLFPARLDLGHRHAVDGCRPNRCPRRVGATHHFPRREVGCTHPTPSALGPPHTPRCTCPCAASTALRVGLLSRPMLQHRIATGIRPTAPMTRLGTAAARRGALL